MNDEERIKDLERKLTQACYDYTLLELRLDKLRQQYNAAMERVERLEKQREHQD